MIDAFLAWVAAHPGWAMLLIVSIAFLDALFVVGVLLPGGLLMLGVGALIALDAIPFAEALGAAMLGALAGDGLNYWLGRRYGQALFRHRWVTRYPDALQRGQQFCERHGGKAVIVGRLVGLLRPIVPAIAGAYNMRAPVFLFMASLAAFLWALLHLLAGAAVGASLSIAAAVAGRLAALIVGLLLLVWLLITLVRVGVVAMQSHAESWLHALLDWSHRHRILGRVGAALADPRQPETPGLAIVAAVLFLLGALWLSLWWGLGWREYPPALDAFVYQALRDLQTPLATGLAVALAQLGEWPVYGPVAVATLLALLWSSRDRAAAHWIAAVAFGACLSLALFALPTFSSPLEYYRGRGLQQYFSGRELILATTIYGFIPVLLATRRRTAQRVLLYGAAIVLIALILIAQLYLGVQWFSMGMAAVAIGALWVAALGLGYRRHRAQRIFAWRFLPLVLGSFLVAAVMHWSVGFGVRHEMARPWWRLQSISLSEWLDGAYRVLPSQRVDIAGRPKLRFNLQWAGDLRAMEAAAAAEGWRWPVRLSLTNVMRWLAPSAPIDELPLLPHVHAGRHQALVLRQGIDGDQQYLLQLWPSTWRLAGGDRIWVGSLMRQRAGLRYGLLRYPWVEREADAPVPNLLQPLRGFRLEQRPGVDGRPVWLMYPTEEGSDE